MPESPATVRVTWDAPALQELVPPPHTFGVPAPPQVCGAVQLPQLRVPPQPSEMDPQFLPWAAHVVGVQLPVQTLLTQVCPFAQVPQSRVPPQPLEALPQLNPRDAHVAGVQVPGLMVSFALADVLLHVDDAATVTKS